MAGMDPAWTAAAAARSCHRISALGECTYLSTKKLVDAGSITGKARAEAVSARDPAPPDGCSPSRYEFMQRGAMSPSLRPLQLFGLPAMLIVLWPIYSWACSLDCMFCGVSTCASQVQSCKENVSFSPIDPEGELVMVFKAGQRLIITVSDTLLFLLTSPRATYFLETNCKLLRVGFTRTDSFSSLLLQISLMTVQQDITHDLRKFLWLIIKNTHPYAQGFIVYM